jgi:para-aminobenzoate synthetase component I
MSKEEQNFIDKKLKMLNWANQFNIFCLLDNNGYNFEQPAFEFILAIGVKKSYTFNGSNDLVQLQQFYDKNPTWLFGHFGYNAIGNAYSKKLNTGFGDGFFFEPEIILKYSLEKLEIVKGEISLAEIEEQIQNVPPIIPKNNTENIVFTPNISKEVYIEKIRQLQRHIKRGDCYEINFCKKFIGTNVLINPIDVYEKLITTSPAPFGSLYKLNENYCICASPERFLKKTNSQLISQPIKGTTKRDPNEIQDQSNKDHLLQSQKEKSENVMVVDLVRNDMSMFCEKGSVHVKELFGVYSFPQVHQMISTIEGKLPIEFPFTKAIEACYPMGSMTGAPKQRVMELIDQYEEQPRGLFSGSIGYISPENNFDFNVVIRSIFYDAVKKEVSFFAGSGITFYSDATAEYEECLMKVAALKACFNA